MQVAATNKQRQKIHNTKNSKKKNNKRNHQKQQQQTHKQMAIGDILIGGTSENQKYSIMSLELAENYSTKLL